MNLDFIKGTVPNSGKKVNIVIVLCIINDCDVVFFALSPTPTLQQCGNVLSCILIALCFHKERMHLFALGFVVFDFLWLLL